MAKSQIVELKDGKIIVSTYKNGVLLASAAPDIESDGFVMGCTITSHEAMTFLCVVRDDVAFLNLAALVAAEQERLKRDADAYSRLKFQESPFTTGEMGQ